METTYCSKCGAKNSKDASFCGNCGEKINEQEITGNICSECGYVSEEDEKYCPDCGTALTSGKEVEKTPKSQPKPTEKKKSQLAAKTPIMPPVKKKKGGFFRTLGKVALWIFGIVVLGVVALYFIGDNIDSPNTLESAPSTVTDITFNPEPVIGSGTKAFEIEPITGVNLKAKQGAIDKNREFQVGKLTDNQVKEIAENLTGIAAVPLKGIYIESGMKDGEIFPGALEVELSLSEFNIPKSMNNSLCIIRTEADGTSAIIPSNVENGQISFETERNCMFAIGLGLAIGSVLVSTVDDFYKFNTLPLFGEDFHVINDIDGYSLYYPARMPQANPTEVKRVGWIIIDILKKYNQAYGTNVNLIMKSPDFMMKLWPILQKDQDFLEVQKLLNDGQWKRENLWPKEISILYNPIKLADTYLFGKDKNNGRGFKKYDNLDIIAFDKWPGSSNIPAQCINVYSKQPYIQVNLSEIPPFRSSAMKGWTDELLPVLVHEIFHSCQVRHLGTFSIDKEKDTWFWEATAVAVEKQAKEYFENNNIINDTEMIISQQNSNYCQKNLAFINGYKDPIHLQNQGYAYAPLIEYISDQYAAKTGKPKENYINYALEKYVEIRNPRATLMKTTTNSNYGFEKLYKTYCHESLSSFISGYGHYQKAKKFPIPVAVNLTKEFPIYKVDHDYESLSMTMRKFNVLEADKKKDYSVKLVLRGTVDEVMSYADGFSIATVSKDSNKKHRELKQPSSMDSDKFDVEIGFGMVANNNTFFLQDVNYDMDNSVNRSYEVFVMYRPATPSLTFEKLTENWYLKIKFDESNLKNMDYVDAYKITLRCPNGDIYSFITEENEFELPISYDRQTLSFPSAGIDFIHSIELKKADSNSTITGDFDLIYRELTSSDAKVMGPQSIVTKLAVDGIVDLTANTDELSIDERITYKVTVTPDKSNYTYYWFINGLVDQESGSELRLTFEEAGTYTAKVTVNDENGKNIGSDSWTCTVTDAVSITVEVNNSEIERIYIDFDFDDYAGEIRGHFGNDNYTVNGNNVKKTIAKRGNKITAKTTLTYAGDSKPAEIYDFSIDGIDNSNNLISISFKKRSYHSNQISEQIIRLANVPFTKEISESPASFTKRTLSQNYTFEGDLTNYIKEVKYRHEYLNDGEVSYISLGSNCKIYFSISTIIN